MKIWCNYRPRPRGSVISRTISSANCIEWPSFRQSDETGTPYFFFRKRKSRQKETWLPLAYARGVVFLDSRIIKRLFARKRQRVFFWLLFFSKRKVTPCLPGIMKRAHKRMKPPTWNQTMVQVFACQSFPSKTHSGRRSRARWFGPVYEGSQFL